MADTIEEWSAKDYAALLLCAEIPVIIGDHSASLPTLNFALL